MARSPLDFMYDAISMSKADDGNLVDISLFSTAPFPRLSVIDGTRRTLVSSGSGISPNFQFQSNEHSKSFQRGDNERRALTLFEYPRKLLERYFQREPLREPWIQITVRITSWEPAPNTSPIGTRLCVDPR